MLNIFKKTVFAIVAFALMSGVTFAGSSIVIKGSTTVLPDCPRQLWKHL